MSAVTSDNAAGRPFKPSFYFWMTVVMAIFVFGGFGMTYWQPMAAGSLQPLPPVVHLHGIMYSTWIVLLLVQAFLINVRNITLHRGLGQLGIAVATCVVLTGTLITILFGGFHISNPMPDYYHLMYLGVVAVINFSLLFFLAIRNVRKPDNHRRLILFATMSILAPGINRFYMVPFGLETLPLAAMYLTVDAMLAAILLQEWRTTAKISATTITAAAIILLPELLHAPITGSGAFAGFCAALADLAVYR
jgi:hypothetical protein